MRECKWRNQLYQVSETPTSFGRILCRDNEESLLNAIRNESVFGFVVADVSTDESLANELCSDGFLFPPVIQRADLDESFFSPYMKERFLIEQEKMSRTTVVQRFNGTQLLLMTPLVKFYLDLGLKVTNITKVRRLYNG